MCMESDCFLNLKCFDIICFLNFSGKNKITAFLIGELHVKIFKPYLKRIADAKLGDGIWWSITGYKIIFFDGDEEPDFRPEGPVLKDYTGMQLHEVFIDRKS